jgi:hypothetical protein
MRLSHMNMLILGCILASLTNILTVPASADQGHCSELFATAPPANTLKTAQFLDGLEKAAKDTDGRGMEWILSKDTFSDLGAGKHLSEIIMSWSQESTTRALADEHKGPQPIEWHSATSPANTISQNALSVYRGGLFFDGFFFNKGLERKNNTATFVGRQPWLEYDFTNNKFIVHESGAQEALIRRWFDSVAGDTVTIYRGLTEDQEMGWMQIIQSLTKFKSVQPSQIAAQFETWKQVIAINDPAKAETFDQSLRKQFDDLASKIQGSLPAQRPALANALSGLVSTAAASLGRDAVFTSPSLDTAKSWGQKGLVALRMSKAQFKELSDHGEIYIGIEGKLEIALISERAQQMFYQDFFSPINNFKWKSPRAD